MITGLMDEVCTVEGVLVDVAVNTAVGIAGIADTAGNRGSLAEWW